MAAAVTGWVAAVVLVVGGTTVVAAAATPSSGPPAPPAAAGSVQEPGSERGSDGSSGRPTAAAPPGARGSPDRGERRAPLPGERARRFEPPPHEYGPGHRGVDLPAAAGAVVVAPAGGVVTFAGPVAGRGVVVVDHGDGTLTSLEPVEPLLAVGTPVGVGDPVARVRADPRHPGCPAASPDGCLHWGVRVDGSYVDPWWWLGRNGPVRLLPFTER